MGEFPALPMAAEAEVLLVRRRVLGAPETPDAAGRISIGHSDAHLLEPGGTGVDDGLARMLARDGHRYRYHLVQLRCTFRDGAGPVVGARLSVALRSADSAEVSDAVVWSMDPLRASTPITDTVEATIGLDGRFAVKRTREIPKELVYLRAEGEGENPAEWVFDKTPAVALAGSHRLSLVTRTSAGGGWRAELALAATRQDKWLGLVPYRAQIPPRAGTIGLPPR